jgi:hypothetical protein
MKQKESACLNRLSLSGVGVFDLEVWAKILTPFYIPSNKGSICTGVFPCSIYGVKTA